MRAVLMLLAAGMFAAPVSAALIGTDNANQAAYDDGWASGDDGAASGNAFGTWTLTSNATAGFFIGNSTNLSSPGADINVSGESFGMFANAGENPFATANRPFNGALSVGQTFSVDIAVNFRNGNKGLDLRSGNTNLFNFNTGGDDYVVNGAATGNGSIGDAYSANTEFNLSFTQTSLAGGTWTITRSGGVSDLDSGTYTGVPDNVQFYIAGTEGGGANDFYFNSLAIVPEPASVALFGAGLALLAARRRKAA